MFIVVASLCDTQLYVLFQNSDASVAIRNAGTPAYATDNRIGVNERFAEFITDYHVSKSLL